MVRWLTSHSAQREGLLPEGAGGGMSWKGAPPRREGGKSAPEDVCGGAPPRRGEGKELPPEGVCGGVLCPEGPPRREGVPARGVCGIFLLPLRSMSSEPWLTNTPTITSLRGRNCPLPAGAPNDELWFEKTAVMIDKRICSAVAGCRVARPKTRAEFDEAMES